MQGYRELEHLRIDTNKLFNSSEIVHGRKVQGESKRKLLQSQAHSENVLP